MFEPDEIEGQSMICDLVPGYAYYNGMGYEFAEIIVNLVEWMLDWRN